MRCKRGAAHFEMIMSFVFFVGFTFFLFMTLTPQDTKTLPESVISGLYDSFGEEVYTNFSEVFLKVNMPSSCFTIDLPKENFEYTILNDGSYVEDLSGERVDSNINMGGSVAKLEVMGSNELFFRVFLSSEFSDTGSSGCLLLGDDDFELGSVVEKKVVSYSSLKEMAVNYSSNYEGLKEELRIPAIFDFSIVAMDDLSADIYMEPSSGIPSSVEVMARDYVFEVLNSSGDLINERISFRVWR